MQYYVFSRCTCTIETLTKLSLNFLWLEVTYVIQDEFDALGRDIANEGEECCSWDYQHRCRGQYAGWLCVQEFIPLWCTLYRYELTTGCIGQPKGGNRVHITLKFILYNDIKRNIYVVQCCRQSIFMDTLMEKIVSWNRREDHQCF